MDSGDDDFVPLPIDIGTECENKSTVKPLYLATEDSNSSKMHIRPPPKSVPAHLKAPPPLTPMRDIASNGLVTSRRTVAATVPANVPVTVPATAPTTAPSAAPNVDPNGIPSPSPPPPPPPVANDSIPPALGGANALDSDFYAPPPPPPPASVPPVMNGPVGGGYAIEYRCSPCHLVFNTKMELTRHKRDVHPSAASSSKRGRGGGRGRGRGRGRGGAGAAGKTPRFHCNLCQRSFSGKQHFEYHMRTHSGEKPFKCTTCGKAFRAKHSLKNHMRIHTGERPYQCKVCGKGFRQLGVMKNHIKNMHEGPRQM